MSNYRISQLLEADGVTKMYPVTHVEAIVSEDGHGIAELINGATEAAKNAQDAATRAEQASAGIAGKADKTYVDAELAKKYVKPTTGIPKTDLAQAVQDSLGKADSALQTSSVDSALSTTSTMPVQNKTVTAELNKKQNTISDLATIRSGAAAGATAVQPSALTSKQDVISDLATIRSGAEKGATAVQPAALNGKQDTISDLATIRSGASAGATAVQPSAISDMETKTHAAATYQPKGNYLTSHQSLANYYTKAEINSMITATLTANY